MRLEVGGWAGPPCGEQLCPPENTGELPEFERPEQIFVVNHFLQPLDRSETWVRGEKEAEERGRWEMMEWKEAVELERQWFGEVKLERSLMRAAGREMRDRGQPHGSWWRARLQGSQDPGARVGGRSWAPRQHLWSFPSTALHPIACLPLPSPLSISDPEQQLRSGQSIMTPWSHPLGTRRRGAPQREWDSPGPLSDLGQSWRSS